MTTILAVHECTGDYATVTLTGGHTVTYYRHQLVGLPDHEFSPAHAEVLDLIDDPAWCSDCYGHTTGTCSTHRERLT